MQLSSYLREPSSAEQERCGDGVVQADPGVALGLDIRPVGTLAHQRVTTHDDAVDRPGCRCVTGAQFRQASITGNSTTPHQ